MRPHRPPVYKSERRRGWEGGNSMLEYYQKNIPEWQTVDHYVNTYRGWECKSSTVDSVFKALEESCKKDLAKWEETAARYMNDERQLVKTISSFSHEILQLRQETYDKTLPVPKRQQHYRRIGTLNVFRKKKQEHLNIIAEVLILICRKIQTLKNVNEIKGLMAARAGAVNHTE